ncbi:uncharacterized protein LOC105204198 [Solenopsis invicta]|uniref:uncharacterized protein LOC105204198 n=1 Tax=Solenopsis invicta TaxID=13686 RepID=UPI00193D31AD|nr:uncharacterized protein LOC105204198 [Solenopsis invicta]
MEELVAMQQIALQTVAKALSNFKKIGKPNYTPAKIRSRITALKEAWPQCTNRHAALLQAVPAHERSKSTYFTQDDYGKHEELYLMALDYMNECLEELEPPVSTSPLASSSHHFCAPAPVSLQHLPPINIPPFSGKAEDWKSFRDRFTSFIILNKDLTAFSRMHFLASSLSGRALDTIKTIPVTADNFDIAWKTLTSRYDNKRRLIEIHASALCNLPSVNRESACELSELRDKANRAIASLKRLNRSSDEILSDILSHHVTQKLDPATRKAWRLKGDDAIIPTYEDLDRFLAHRVRALEELTPLGSAKSSRSVKSSSAMVATASISPCPLCKSAHFLNKCPQFVQKSPSQRLEIAKQHQRCVNCFSAKHAVSACPSRFSCRHCQKRHHSMLHLDSASSATATVSASDSETPASNNSDKSPKTVALCAISANLARPPVVLATARVFVGPLAGRQVAARALIDTGAELTLVAAHLAKKLKLRQFILPTALSAVDGLDAGIHRYAAHIQISPIDGIEPPVVTTATILSSLASYSSASIQSPLQWDHLADLTLADPNSSSTDPIDLIIGADIYPDIMRDGVRRGSRGQPIAQETIFGWIVQGRTPLSNSSRRTITVQHCTIAESVSLDSELRRFWEIEEIPRHTILSPEEQRCENHFLTSHSRTPAGQYIVRLPFKSGPPIDIGTSRDVAERCLKTLLRRLQANFDLKREYSDFLQEYENLGHMRKAPESSESSQFVYIPHHPVIRESSATTRVRVVFNASSPTSNSRSLNDHLLAGQKLQTDLAAVLLRWRQYRYVYSADVAKMYRQIRVDPRDTDYQRILWIDEKTGRVQEYQLLTVTYGTTSAPFLALRVLQQLIHDDGRDFPLAVPVLKENIYVDDVLFGADEISLIRTVRNQVCSLLQRGHFELRKWSSNAAHLLSDIDAQDHGLACNKDLHPDETLKVLGISWSPSADAFQFRVVRCPSPARTKRAMLSYIARMFDPLGLGTPVTISAKILLQKLWQLRVDWDDEVSTDIARQWESVQSSLLELDNFHLPRWIQKGSDTVDCEIHGFLDASNYAYAAAIYIRLTSRSGNITTALLVGKSKVAPIKTLTVPRLELSAAVLMSRLTRFVMDALHITSVPCFCWTDSTVVLAWVTQHPSKWKTFISNRVAEIQTRLPSASWRYVPTDENPADCASRGVSGSQLVSHPLWWHGPA